MEITNMSLTRVLAEIKLLDKKIMDAQSQAVLIDFRQKKAQRTLVLGIDEKAASARVTADFDSIQKLISNRQALKSSLVSTNATTKVTIAGVEYTIAGAIERKASIKFESDLLRIMKMQYTRYQAHVNQLNAATEATISKMTETHLGASKGSEKISSEALESISAPIRDRETVLAIDPLDLATKIASMQKTIDDFTKDVDFSLSEINAKTEIQVNLGA